MSSLLVRNRARALRWSPVLAVFGCGGDTSIVEVPNNAPEVAITTPPDGTAYDEGDLITFSARVDDDRQRPEELFLVWASDVDGTLHQGTLADASGTVVWVTANLSPGNHVVSLTAVDDEAGEGLDWVELTIHDVPDAPEITILHPIAGEYGVEGEPFEFEAYVRDLQDEASDLVVWMSSDVEEDVDFCEAWADASGVASCEASLSVGEHNLVFTVYDSDDYSDSATVYYEVVSAGSVDDDGDGWNENQGDCDDTDPSVHPTAEEYYNGVDDDCDGIIDEDTEGYDDDEDGYSELEGDCDDDDDDVYPGAPETCDGLDNDCDTLVDEGTSCVDDDGDGWTEADGDCDDDDDDTYPGAPETPDGADNDCDGTADEGTSAYDDDGDCFCETGPCTGGADRTCTSLSDGDCDDAAAAVNPAASERCDGIDNDCDGVTDEPAATDAPTWYNDSDGDGYGDPAAGSPACIQPAGTVADATDCDDTVRAVNPAATELCDGIDNDCDGTVDEDDAADASTWYRDSDGDGYGDAGSPQDACSQPTGYIAEASDCDDAQATTNPGAVEYCDGHDDDCDGVADEDDAADASTWFRDADGDGYGDPGATDVACSQPSGHVANDSDCDDGDAGLSPDTPWYLDADGDGYGDASSSLLQCLQPSGHVANDDDCDDGDASLHPATVWYIDGDGDGYGSASYTLTQCLQPSGYVASSSDCNDSDRASHPGATEYCDGHDDDCDGAVDEDDAADAATWYRDADADGYGSPSSSTAACTQPTGYVADATDCDDGETSTHPGATEYCDGHDDDCDGSVDEDSAADAATWYRDADGDGYGDAGSSDVECSRPSGYVADATDCDDGEASTHPGATEYCDGHDDDCDGSVDEDSAADAATWYRDADGDGYGNAASTTAACSQPTGWVADATDCDDGASGVNPGALDEPDMGYQDLDCDGIDGDLDGSVFLDPTRGSDSASGLTSASPVRSLDRAYSVALTHGIDWILLSDGSVALSGGFEEAVHLAGGYDAAAGWSRSLASRPEIPVSSAGQVISGWSLPTEWQQLRIEAASNSSTGGSSFALRLHSSSGLLLDSCEIASANAGDGSHGSGGSAGSSGSRGGSGGNGCEDSSGFCSSCSRPSAGGGGSGCYSGGSGGRPGKGSSSGDSGSAGSGTSAGAGGSGGSGGRSGSGGHDGSNGSNGSNGGGGSSSGSFSSSGYAVSSGSSGSAGQAGSGGGGGGGGGGGDDWCDSYGGGGGGGGGGACGGSAGTRGTGGGASVAILLVSSSIELVDCSVQTGAGGDGGNGGTGGGGGIGGSGGSGGSGEDDSGGGGSGGSGGDGGDGGHGGGGGGGPSVGIQCTSSTVVLDSSTSFSLGSAGAGGSSAGASGSAGLRANTNGC